MMLFVEKGIRGGITQCCTKYSKTNNKYLNGKNYDPTKPPTHIMYMDMVNLYGWAQSQCLPLNNFKWLSEAKLKSLTPEAILNVPDDAVQGLILVVDLSNKDVAKEFTQTLDQKLESWEQEENLEKLWTSFKVVVLDTARKTCGISKMHDGKKKTAWWSEKIKLEVKKKWQQYIKSRTPDKYEEYKHQRGAVKNLVLQAKKKSWEDFGRKLEENSKGNQKLFFKQLYLEIMSDIESSLVFARDQTPKEQELVKCIEERYPNAYVVIIRGYRGGDCMRWFADEMNKLAEDVSTVFLCPYKMHMTPQQELEFQAATHCHICEQSFKSGQKKVRDHNHLIPENNFRGAACEGCNVNYQDTHTIPVVFHNLSGYDAHFVVTDIATRMDGKIDLLPITKEKYISFTKHINESRICFRFIDSFRFMASSLDKLSSALTNFPNLKSQFSTLPEDQFNILTKKGIMPYDYFDSFDRFDELCLPPQDAFYNKLEDKPCPRRMYRRAQEVWSRFNCSNLGQYVDLYMKTDILLLADVFEQFRSSCISTYDLDPAHYFTLPGFTWDAMLKYTQQELELLTDQDMFLFVERGIRGGLSQVCCKRRAHANNKYMLKYDSTKPDVYLMYNDINNQYGWSMSQYLPYGGFEWVDSNIDIATIPDDADEGYILEVDLTYPKDLHQGHAALPEISNGESYNEAVNISNKLHYF
ncbi:hypothetical protein PPYR_02399 [Photinus pyralis]|uniref:DNA-directed DNA polymerase n=1 Tax=Photinus pyralis TaxID=7054 RepID=A0A5N4B748_PHOPY|nr:hypothetical protein PPYR_02399 [Photinus pyralis]